MGSNCSCGLPWMTRGGERYCAHCDRGLRHVVVFCKRCQVIALPKP